MTHHAYVCFATTLETSVVPSEFHTPTVDVEHMVVDTLGIDQARLLSERASRRAVTEGGRTFVVVAGSITVQAQNALLKLFEEPPTQVQFYVVVQPGANIIATLRSRLAVMDQTVGENDHAIFTSSSQNAPSGCPGDSEADVFTEFLQTDYQTRLATIADRVKQKDTLWITSVLSGVLWQAAQSTSLPLKQSAMLASEYATRPGASKKMLLEELALSLPQT